MMTNCGVTGIEWTRLSVSALFATAMLRSSGWIPLLFVLYVLPVQAQAPDFETVFKVVRSPAPSEVATAASPNFDAAFYHLMLDVRFAPKGLIGQTWIEGRITRESLSTLRLDLHRAMQVDSVRSAQGAQLAFTHQGDVLVVQLPAPVSVGHRIGVWVHYRGVPVPAGYGAFVFDTTTTGRPVAWSLSEPYGARRWWPSKDHPSDKADSVRVTVTVPRAMRVGSNGLLTGTTYTDTTATYDWHSRYPIAPYLISIAAAEYAVEEQRYRRPDSLAARLGPLDLPILHYAYPEKASLLFEGWRWVTDAFPVFESWFGAYPFPEEKYGHAQMTGGGGMEHQTMSTMGGSSLPLVVHELAHQWFGDLLTNRTWPDLWLNEGFATYSEGLYWQYRTDHPEFWETYLNGMFQRARSRPGAVALPDTTVITDLFSHRTYFKGAAVLHMLRGVVGDPAFRDILQTYVRDPRLRYGSVTTTDFQRIAERISGRDLGVFFVQWLYRSGYPIYEVDWQSVENGTAVTLRQLQPEPVFVMPVTLQIETRKGTHHRFRVEQTQREQTFVLNVSAPVKVVFDPDRWLLRNQVVPVRQVALEQEGGPSGTLLYPPFPNPAGPSAHVVISLAQAGMVTLEVVDVLGRQVRLLFEGERAAGTFVQQLHLDSLVAGTYFLRLHSAAGIQSQQLVRIP